MSSLAILFLIIGIFGIFYYPREMKQQTQSHNWLSTEGTVLNVTLKALCSEDGSNYIPNFTYEYYVNEEHYYGSTIAIGEKSLLTSKEYDEKMKDIYSGKKVTVYYDPEDPHQCVLKRGAPTDSELESLYLLSFFIVALGIIMLLWEFFNR